MSGTPLGEFTTLMASQGPAWASGPEVLINEAVKRRYTHSRIQNGKRMDEMCQGGDEIKDTIFLEEKSTFRRYNPNVKINVENPQTGITWTVPWAFATAHMSWTKQEIGLNKDTTTAKFRAQRYKALMYQKHQNLWTDMCNSMEDELWATPNETDMESSTPSDARVPYSIPCFITENTNGAPLNADNTSWSTVQGISPSAQAKWRNQQETYTYNSSTDTTTIFTRMSKLLHQVKFDRLPKHGEYSDKTTSPHVILCSLAGMTNYEHALRTNQDEFRGIGKTSGQDPDYNNPTFRNVPLDYIEALDTASLYTDGSATADEDGATLTGPRYYFVNGEYMNFIWHSENYCILEDPVNLTAGGQPFTYVQHVDCWNNLIARSRYRQGILSPSADTVNA